jgi:hypothetical protein
MARSAVVCGGARLNARTRGSRTTFVDGTDATSRPIFFTELVASTTAERSARERL